MTDEKKINYWDGEQDILDFLAGAISCTDLAKSLSAKIEKRKAEQKALIESVVKDVVSTIAEEICRQVIKQEMRPGGLVWELLSESKVTNVTNNYHAPSIKHGT